MRGERRQETWKEREGGGEEKGEKEAIGAGKGGDIHTNIHKLKVKTKASTGSGNHVFTSWGISLCVPESRDCDLRRWWVLGLCVE